MRRCLLIVVLILLARYGVAEQESGASQSFRVLSFPFDRSVGALISLNTRIPHTTPADWWWGAQAGQFETLAKARGEFRAPDGMRMGLIVDKEASEDPAVLDGLPPDGLELLVLPCAEGGSVSADAQIERISRLTGLKTLVVQGACVSSQSLGLLERLTSLERLAVQLRQLDTTAAGHLARLKTLQGLRVYLEGPEPSRAAWSCVAGLTGLRELGLSGSARGADLFPVLAALPSLETLYVGAGDCGSEGFDALARFPSLRRLEFYDLTDEGLKHLPPIASLKELTIQGKHPGFSPEAFANLAQQPALEKLNLRGRFSDEAIARLAGLRTLKELGLHGLFQDTDYVTDQALAHIGTMTSLESLLLYTGRFTDDAVASLAPLDHLKRLHVVNNSFSDAGLQQIAKLHSLEELRIRSDGFTDAGVLTLAELASLQRLTLVFNREVTEDGLTRLREKNPSLVTEQESPVTSPRKESPQKPT